MCHSLRGFCEQGKGFKDPERYSPRLLLLWLESVDEVPDDLYLALTLQSNADLSKYVERMVVLGIRRDRRPG